MRLCAIQKFSCVPRYGQSSIPQRSKAVIGVVVIYQPVGNGYCRLKQFAE